MHDNIICSIYATKYMDWTGKLYYDLNVEYCSCTFFSFGCVTVSSKYFCSMNKACFRIKRIQIRRFSKRNKRNLKMVEKCDRSW